MNVSRAINYIQLGPFETVEGRPFTNPVDSVEDLASLQYMVNILRRHLSQPKVVVERPLPFVLYLKEEGDRYHRLALSKPELLLDQNDLTVVGFCGQKRPGADRAPIDTVDQQLIAEFSYHPYLLSYSTLQLADGNASNLVLFNDPRGITHWAKGTRHAYAASELAPRYYLRIRLHNAILPGGITSGNELVLLRTKYYDYEGDTTWWGVRELGGQGS